VPFPVCLHCKARPSSFSSNNVEDAHNGRDCCQGPIDDLRMIFKMQSHPKETAAIVVEPILGEGGFVVPPEGFFSSLREICDEHEVLLIFDEVQSGAGRTGTWWAHEQLSGHARPDVMIFAKGIASGFPFAGLATRGDLFDGLEPGSMGGTYGGAPVGCAAAVATIEAIEKERMLENAQERGDQMAQALKKMMHKGLPIVDVRGRGLMIAAELENVPGMAGRITSMAAKERGLLLVTCSAREVVRFMPPLMVSGEEVEEAMQTFEACLEKCC
jgi:4-aminobutyrate aminotransferase